MVFSIYPPQDKGDNFMKFYGWFINRKVLPDTALRVLLLFRYRVENNPHIQEKKILSFSRRDICFSTGLSYNSVQAGLRVLIDLRIIQLDPLGKGSKQVIKLTEPIDYHWEIIQEKLGFNFKPAVKN